MALLSDEMWRKYCFSLRYDVGGIQKKERQKSEFLKMSRTRSWAIFFYWSYAREFKILSSDHSPLGRLLCCVAFIQVEDHCPVDLLFRGLLKAAPKSQQWERARWDGGGDETRLDIHSRLTNFNTHGAMWNKPQNWKKEGERKRDVENLRFINSLNIDDDGEKS